MTYIARLHEAIARTKTPALVGLDPNIALMPPSVVADADSPAAACERFCCDVIDVVAGIVPAVKPQSAYFEQHGPDGVAALARVMTYARNAGLIVLLDAKRGDIGSTGKAYAAGLLAGTDPSAAPFASDALTVSPYLGPDTLQPFVDRAHEVEGGLYILVRTSNPQSAVFQDRTTDGTTVYEAIGDHVERLNREAPQDNGYGSIGAVVGATYPQELVALRERMPSTPFLIPGYGSQGGGAADVLPAVDREGRGGLINSSRGILYAHAREPFAERFGPENWQGAVEAATHAMIDDLTVSPRPEAGCSV